MMRRRVLLSKKASPTARLAFRVSAIIHGVAVLAVCVVPLLAKACVSKKEPEELMFVEFTVSAPPPPAEEIKAEEEVPPEPEPEVKPPEVKDPIPEPEPPKPEPKKEEPKPKKNQVVRQTNSVTRTFTGAPPPQDKPMSQKEIEAMLAKGAKFGAVTSIPDNASDMAMGAYYNHIQERFYAAWTTPGVSLPGLSAGVEIVVQPNGRVSSSRITRSSGNDAVDQSVREALARMPQLNPLPAGCNKGEKKISINFRLE